MEKTKTDNKINWAFLTNLLIVIFEIIALVLSIKRHGIRVFKYYTEISNYFALIVSAIFCIYAIFSKNGIKSWVVYLRYIATVCLTITFVVVSLVLIPMYPASFNFLMFNGSSFFHHLACPVLSIISFLLFENQMCLKKFSIVFPIIPTLLYGVICIVLNILKVLEGPYPFFYVYDISWVVCAVSAVAILLTTFLISFVFYKIFNMVYEIKIFKNKQKYVQF